MQASMFKPKSDKHDQDITEGEIYLITNFRVSGPQSLFNVLSAQYSIGISRDTCITKTQAPAQPIPTYYFELAEFDSLKDRKKDNRILSGTKQSHSLYGEILLTNSIIKS